MSTEIKLGWWARQSTTMKWVYGLTGVGLAIAAAVGISAIVKSNKLKKETTTDKKEIAETETKPVAEVNEQTATHVENQTTTPKEHLDLPNNGEDCSRVYTDYDGNYNYVFCKDVWFTKSKEKPSGKGAVIAAWKSLAGNKVATDMLNRRYYPKK